MYWYFIVMNHIPLAGDPTLVHSMLIGGIVLSCLSGVAVAFIVKKLDNIVKLYTQALSNMLTSLACSFFFPDHFHLNLAFFGCLVLMFIAISLYESKNVNLSTLWTDLRNWLVNAPIRDKLFIAATCAGLAVVAFVLH
jgi:hypothetical protein